MSDRAYVVSSGFAYEGQSLVAVFLTPDEAIEFADAYTESYVDYVQIQSVTIGVEDREQEAFYVRKMIK